MAVYSADFPVVLVQNQKSNNENDIITNDGVVCDEVRLPADTFCGIVYPNSLYRGEVMKCEISTFEVDASGQEGNLVLQTIADREFINAYKTIPGHLTKLKILNVHDNPDLIANGKLDSFTEMVYCQPECIENKEFWSPAVDYVPGKTKWNGGPCEIVCRSKDYEKIQMIHYDGIFKLKEEVFIFCLTNRDAGVDILWNALPIEQEVNVWGSLGYRVHIQPHSFRFVTSRTSIWK